LSLSFFFYLPATSEIHPLSLHDALPLPGQELTSRACHHLTGTELIAGNGRNAQTKQPLANGSPPPGPLQEDKVEPDGKRNSSQNVQLQVQAVLNESLPIPPGDNWKQKRLHPHKRTERYDYIDN